MEIVQPGQSLDPSEYVASVSNLDGTLTISPTTGDVVASLNTAHSNTWTASQTFLEDTIFSDIAPLNGHELKLVSYLKDNVLYDASWTFGHGNNLSVPDTNQVIIGNNNSMTGFLGFINGIGNTSTGTEDLFINGLNNNATGTSGGTVSGIANNLTNGATVYVNGISNNTGAFSNQFISGFSCTTSADNTFAIGNTLTNSLASSLDIGISDATKATLTTTYGRFRTDVGVGTIPSAKLHVLSTTSQLWLSYSSGNEVKFTVDSGGNLALQTTAGATAGVYTLTPHGAGGSGTNRTLSFGNGFGNPALWLYSNGATTRHGWGMQADAMQFFQPSITGAVFTWNRGGDLQATGTNELMRLVQFASGKAGLSIAGAGGAFNATTPYKIEIDGESLAGGTAGVEDFFRVRRGQTGGVSYPEAFSMGLGRYSSSGVGPDTRVDFSLKSSAATNFTTNTGVMSLNSNARVLIGAVGAAGSTCDVAGSLQCDSITNDTGLAHGTYTPTLTGVANVSSSTARLATYLRVGNSVTVSGQIDVTPTSNNTQTTIGISLPVASNFSTAYQAGGVGHTTNNTTAGHGASIIADATNDRVTMDYYETHGAADTISYTFTYQVI